jgi:hypothetical protein
MAVEAISTKSDTNLIVNRILALWRRESELQCYIDHGSACTSVSSERPFGSAPNSNPASRPFI